MWGLDKWASEGRRLAAGGGAVVGGDVGRSSSGARSVAHAPAPSTTPMALARGGLGLDRRPDGGRGPRASGRVEADLGTDRGGGRSAALGRVGVAPGGLAGEGPGR